MGILDTIIDNKQIDSLKTFEPAALVEKLFEQLKDREKQILSARFGLNGLEIKTLEVIGKEQNLTRERVRQIEKNLLKQLQSIHSTLSHYLQTRDLILHVFHEHGGIVSKDALFDYLKFKNPSDINGVIFFLHLLPEVTSKNADSHSHEAWHLASFNLEWLYKLYSHVKQMLTVKSAPQPEDAFIAEVVATFSGWTATHDPKIIPHLISLSKDIKRNAFLEYGLLEWPEIQPKDVGDKAYLVMKHHKKPEHYSVITQLINKYKFDAREAFKETVHNELIKDKRFILVGRGIYALAEWGYKPGVVADVITEVLKEKQKPMSREEIVDAVLAKRLVKKNTILVGLSNKKLFKKVGKNLYTLIQVE